MSEATPDPHGGILQLSVRCHVDPAHRRRPRSHPVSLHPDWSVDTGHDLEAERISVAFGGYLSCIPLVDQVVPAARVYLLRQLRLQEPNIRRGSDDRWSLREPAEDCCSGTVRFRSPQAAATHLRSAKHIAAEHGARRAAIASVAGIGQALLAARELTVPVRLPQAGSQLVGTYIAGRQDAVDLWDAGLSPEAVRGFHEQVSARRPLSPTFYLGVISNRPDLRWVRESAAKAPERETQHWLAWSETPTDRRFPQRRGEWLTLGILQRDIDLLSETAYTPADVEDLARPTDKRHACRRDPGVLGRCGLRADCRGDLAGV